ncbi:MAG: hotdog domain-containing protein, partial [Rhodoplanes sp.]
MTPVVENKTLDEIHAGDSVSIDRSLNRADLRLWASLTGNPNLDEHFIEARGVSTWATSLFFTLIGSKLPGIGSTIEGATTRYHRPVAIGEKVTATVTVKEVRRDTGSIVLDCLCIDASGALVADAFIEVGAPKTKLRKEYAGHRLEELVDRCRGLPPMPTAVVHPCSADALMGAVEAVHHKL